MHVSAGDMQRDGGNEVSAVKHRSETSDAFRSPEVKQRRTGPVTRAEWKALVGHRTWNSEKWILRS